MNENVTTPELTELLSHTDWVRGLALRLVRDPGAADDIVQDTWMAALRKPPTPGRPLRAWLGGVVRNLARQRHRAEARRTRREQVAAARFDTSSSSESLTEQIEIQRDLSQAVIELAEPFRSTVILRYFKGFSSAEIARQQGVPAATVRSRLKRGLSDLRAKLDHNHGGDRRAWTAVLVSFVHSSGAATAPAAVALTGVLALNTFTKIALAATVLLITTGILMSSGVVPTPWGEPDRSSTGLTARAEEEHQPNTNPVLLANGQARPTTSMPETASSSSTPDLDATPKTTTRVTARVLDKHGKPIEGATLHCVSMPTIVATTNDEGRARLDLGIEPVMPRVRLLIRAKHCATRAEGVTLEQSASVDVGDVVLSPGSGLRGKVIDLEGRLVDGARVFATKSDIDLSQRYWASIRGPQRGVFVPRAHTDNGAFVLPGLPIGFVRIWAVKQGTNFAYTEPVQVMTDKDTEGVVITLKPLGPDDAVRGIVVYPDGRPAKGATVSYELAGPAGGTTGQVTSQHDGHFIVRTSGLADVALQAVAADGWASPLKGGIKSSADIVRVTLEHPRTVRVTVKTLDGKMPNHVDIHTETEVDEKMFAKNAVVNSDGTYECPAPSDRFLVSVKADGYRSLLLGPLPEGSEPESIVAELKPLPQVHGRVMAKGAPVQGARVRLHLPASLESMGRQGRKFAHRMGHAGESKRIQIECDGFVTNLEPQPIAETVTDEAGRFSLGSSSDGPLFVRVDAEGYAPEEMGDVRPDDIAEEDSGLRFDLHQGGNLVGHVRAKDLVERSGVIVGVSRSDGYAQSCRTDSDGAYKFERLMPGPYELRVLKKDIVSGATPAFTIVLGSRVLKNAATCRVREGEVTTCDIQFESERVSSSVVQGSVEIDGAPAKGWRYIVYADAKNNPVASGPNQLIDVGKMDANGLFTVTVKRAGTYRFAFASDGGASHFQTYVLNAGINPLSIEIATGILEGVFESDVPAADELVWWVSVQNENEYSMTTISVEDDGTFRIEGAPVGAGRIIRSTLDEMDAKGPALEWPAVIEATVTPGNTTKVTIK